MLKRDFWYLTYPRGMDARSHTYFWNLYKSLGESQQVNLVAAIETLAKVRLLTIPPPANRRDRVGVAYSAGDDGKRAI